MSTAKFNVWQNPDGTENYKCRAWVNFNGTGTVVIRAAGNVSSITDNGTGDYTVNFTTAMPDANYVCNFTTGDTVSVPTNRSTAAGEQTTTTVRARISISSTAAAVDMDYCSITVFR